MSRRRQRGAAYRARRAEYRAMRRGITQTARYMQWLEAAGLSVQVASGAALDELAKLTPASEEEIRARYAVIASQQLVPIASLEEAMAFFGDVSAGPATLGETP